MAIRRGKQTGTPEQSYDRHGILGELLDEPIEVCLSQELRSQVLSGRRRRRLQNISIKLDPAQIIALRKIATMQSIPYQTLIRKGLADLIRRELRRTA